MDLWVIAHVVVIGYRNAKALKYEIRILQSQVD